jgi:FkbM family methyltransferase
MYKSQYKQDYYLDIEIFHGKKNGVFVDVGAYDGYDISNTYHFEKDLGWTGLCIEPSPQTFELLKKNRNCILENCAIGNVEGELEFVNITGWGSSASGFNDTTGKILQTAKDCVEQHGGLWEIIKIPTYRLDTILKKHNLRMVDYMSIDVEGFEINVVKSIDWNKYYIKYLSIEKNVSIVEVTEHLTKFSYNIISELEGDFIFKLNR